MAEINVENLDQMRKKLNAHYGPLDGWQWADMNRVVTEHDDILLEFALLTDHFDVPVMDLILADVLVRTAPIGCRRPPVQDVV